MSMRPSWDDAPNWANWLAMNSNGNWTWYETKPVVRERYYIWDWVINEDGSVPKSKNAYINYWKGTLEQRPEKVT